MQQTNDHSSAQSQLTSALGNTAPLISGRRAPDKRRISLRWLFGTVLTGVTSLGLMGGALYAALDGRQQLARPASILDKLTARAGGGRATKGDRLVSIVALEPSREKILQVPTVTKVGNSNVIRKKPFAYASAPLAIVPTRKVSYPKFNPLNVFSTSRRDRLVASSDVIYSANVEGEVTIRTTAFPLDSAVYDTKAQLNANEAEAIVSKARHALAEGDIAISSLPWMDDSRFELEEANVLPVSLGISVTAENVTRVEPSDDLNTVREFTEEVVVISRPQSLAAALGGADADKQSVAIIAEALRKVTGDETIEPGTRIRASWERPASVDGKAKSQLRRASLYRRGRHIESIATDDSGNVLKALEPAPIPATADSGEEDKIVATVARANLPTAYDGIYRAALSQGLNKSHARRIVRSVAFDVDFRSTISPKDELEVFYSVEEGEDEATDASEILYIGLTLNNVKRRYYRFRATDDGTVDYYDENGKSAKKFLLRQPVPNGRFRSKFGKRRHPISRRVKMHWGVDFSAPRGTPILSAGNGVVEKAGWNAGYGRQTIIRHANGYKTSYSHQHRFAKGIKPGARVRQGQIIGKVGSTGYSTGPHLHYEVIVNGNKVNPMKIRLPNGRRLRGRTLASFKRERARIDALLQRSRDTDTTVASLN